ncbi:MAG TPA: ABC transporter ATP-binding protein [Firmicutes bacterium]|nr:ABC transporter ATP-binding protein [Bacillota bacterium]
MAGPPNGRRKRSVILWRKEGKEGAKLLTTIETKTGELGKIKKDDRKQLRTGFRLFCYVRPYWKELLAALVAMILVSLVNLAFPYLFGNYLIDQVLNVSGNLRLLNTIVIGVLFLAFFKGIFSYFQRYLTSYIGQRVVTNIREEVFQHLQRMSVGFLEAQRIGELIARITSDVEQIQTVVSSGAISVFSNSFMLVGIITAVLVINWRLALITLTVLPLIVYVVSKAGHRIRGISHRVQEKIADLTAVLQETFTGIRVVKAFTMEKHEAKRFARENEASFNANMKSAQALAFLTPIVDILYVVGLALVLWFGGMEVLRGRLTTGRLVTFFTYIGMLGTPITSLTNTINSFQQALAGADRLFQILDHEEDLKDKPKAIALPEIRGEVEFQKVSFGYRPGQEILSGINLRVAPGEIVALVGPSGAGKTSLVNLIPRFYVPTSGAVLVDGYDLREVKVSSLRRQIGLVPQETILFGVSIRENIAYGKPEATEEEIITAAMMANAHEFISALPEGYDTLAGERGSKLSGGQKQRIAIARALLRNPRILILDEATSALDTEAERLVQEALERLLKGRTTFIIAHRLSTVQGADKIVVLSRGKIVEVGTHEALLQANGLYAKMHGDGRMFKNDEEESDESNGSIN